MKYKILILIAVFGMTCWTSCNIDDIPNPNETSLEDILQDASPSELQTVVTGIESLMGQDLGFYYDVVAIIGRDYWFFTGSDPRYTGEVLGRENSQLDNAGFYGTRPYFGRYRTVKNCNILLEAVANAAPGLTDTDVNGYGGFAKTIQAHELLLVLNLQYQNGIRLDVADPDNLGGFASYDDALADISALLDEAAAQLSNATFKFSLSSGFAGFDTPTTFRQFNRAMAARVAVYQGNGEKAKTALGESFFDESAPMSTGPALYFSIAGGEASNPLFRPTGQADAIIAHPSFVEAVEGTPDARQDKIQLRTKVEGGNIVNDTLRLDGLQGVYDVVVYKSLSDNLPLIRNEELALIAAEANIGSDNAQAELMLNIVRVANNLPVYSGGTSDAELTDEMLHQRWLSLWGEGHRWVDMRRYGRLGELPIDRVGDDVWEQMPRPVTEN